MSDYEAPSTDYDNETELTTGTDVVDGGPNDLIIGELTEGGAGGLDTFNPSDVINSGGTLRLTATGSSVDFAGAVVNDVNAVEIRNFTTGNTFSLNTINWGEVPNWVSVNSSGDTEITNIAGAGDFTFQGGPGGDAASFEADFLDSVHQGDDDEMHFAVDGANVDIEINVNGSGSEVENVHFIADGTDSQVYAEIYGAETVLVDGDAANFDLWMGNAVLAAEEGLAEAGSDSWLSSVDSTDFDGNFSFNGALGNDDAGTPVTIDTGIGNDSVYAYGDENSDIKVKSGKGNDDISVVGFDDIIVAAGKGNNDVFAWGTDDSGESLVKVTGGEGDDYVSVYTPGDFQASLDKGDNTIFMEGGLGMKPSAELADAGPYGVGGDATINTKGGADILEGAVEGDLMAVLGGGQDMVGYYDGLYVGGDANIDTGKGSDYVDMTVDGDLIANFGGGADEIYFEVYNNDGDFEEYAADINTGGGNDFVRANVDGDLKAVLGKGNDIIGVTNVEGYVNVIGGKGNDQMRIGDRELTSDDTYKGGLGNNSIFAGGNDGDNGLLYLDEDDSFAGVSDVQTVSITDDSSQFVEFSGEDTGANAAGVMNYVFELDEKVNAAGDGQIESNYDMMDMIGGVNFDIGVDNGDFQYFNLDLADDAEDKSATINFFARGDSSFADVSISDVEMLDITLTDNEIEIPINFVESVTFGEDTTFQSDSTLEELSISGDMVSFSIERVLAPALSLIDASGVSEDVSFGFDPFVQTGLDELADEAEVLTGDGNDLIVGTSPNTAFTIDSGAGSDTIVLYSGNDDIIDSGDGNDTVYAGAGEDNIDLGEGDDTAIFLEDELTSADVVAGGGGYNTVSVLAGELNSEDNFFFQWSDIQNLVLADGSDTLRLQAIAAASGLERIDLSSGGNDTILIQDGWHKPLTAVLGDGSDDRVDARDTDAVLTINGFESAFTAADTLRGGTTDGDTINIAADDGSAEFGNQVRDFETVNIFRTGATEVELTTHNQNIAAGATLVVDATDLIGDPNVVPSLGHAPANFTLNGGDETNTGIFDVRSGQGDDNITTGDGNDIVDGGLGDDYINTIGDQGNNDGNDMVMAGGGDDIVEAGDGDNTVYGQDGGDLITTLEGIDMIDGGADDDEINAGDGNDTVLAGTGADEISGEGGADMLDAGDDTDIDTFFYTDLADSAGAMTDTITNFHVDEDLIDLSALGAEVFVGNGTSPNQTTGLLTAGNGIIEAVFEIDINTLWVDLDDNAELSADDLQIVLTGVDAMSTGDFIFA